MMKVNLCILSTILIMSSCGHSDSIKQEKEKKKLVETRISKKKRIKENVLISTNFGDIEVELLNETPIHRDNFLKLVKDGFYDSTTFHRIIDGFMIQGGDPNSKNDNPNDDGQGGPGYTLEAEIMPHAKHLQGALAAARIGGPSNPEKRSSGSQFYIVENAEGAHNLDGDYTVFGYVVSGIDVVEKIANQKKNKDRPIENIYMIVKVKKTK